MKVEIDKFMENVFDSNYEGYKKSRKWLIGLLESSPVEVTFTKRDGTERVMNCTLQPEYLPETVGDIRKKNDDSLAVYDLEAEGWRSFRWDSIKGINFTIGG